MTSADQHLTRITLRANQRIDELFESAQARTLPHLTVGMVRIVLDVAQETAVGCRLLAVGPETGRSAEAVSPSPANSLQPTANSLFAADEEGADILVPLDPSGLDAQALDRVAAKVKAALHRKRVREGGEYPCR